MVRPSVNKSTLVHAQSEIGDPAPAISHSPIMKILAWACFASAAFLAVLAVGIVPGGFGSDAADAATEDGVLFGAWAETRNGEDRIGAVESLERDLGSTLPIVRTFDRWDTNLDNSFNNWVVDGDRRLMISVKPQRRDGSIVRWDDIANAQPGSQLHGEMVALARAVGQLDGDVWFTFHHEPEASSRLPWGDSDDFKNAWNAMHRVFEQEGAGVEWVWTLTSFGFEVPESDRRFAGHWYPGDATVDFLGADPYNWNECRGDAGEVWTSFEDLVEPFMDFARSHPDKQLVLPEFGSAEGSSGRKAQWLDEAASFLKRPDVADRFAAVIYFHDTHPGSPACNWWLDSTPQSLDAARRIANDPFFNGSGPVTPAPTTTTTTVAPTTTTAAPTTTTVAPSPPTTVRRIGGRVVIGDPVGYCTVRSSADGDVISWEDQPWVYSYNVRRNDVWVGGTVDDSLTNYQVTSGDYVLVIRGGGSRTDLACTRLS